MQRREYKRRASPTKMPDRKNVFKRLALERMVLENQVKGGRKT